MRITDPQAPPATLFRAILFQAERTPAGIAIKAPGKNGLTYASLVAFIREIAGALRGYGGKNVRRVAVMMPQGPEAATAFLAVASFAAAAPLNPDYKGEDLEFFLSDLKADALLIDSQLDSPARQAAARLGIPVIEAVPDPSRGAGSFSLAAGQYAASDTESFYPSPEETALYLHTSGTTARPKLVPLTQRNLCASARNIVSALNLTQADCCLNIMPLFHIHGLIAAVLSSIAGGGSVVCTPGLDCNAFFNWLGEFKPTWYTGVPTTHQAILSAAPAHLSAGSLRFIRSSSSALAPPVMAALEKTFRVPVIEAYGMTEAAHQMASNPLPPGQRKAGSVGLPCGPKIAVLDRQGLPLDRGTPGEIAIRGENVTPGYEGNPKANLEAFTDGWFRTGDLGHFDEDGYLFLSGRIKEIVNRGGEKISPREIDEALLEHPDIVQAAAYPVSHPTLGEDLAAAVVLNKDSHLDSHRIRRFLFEKLPGFKVPSQILIVDEIPKGPSGKIQRIGLAEKLAPFSRQDYSAPQTGLEKMLADTIGELLKIGDVGRHDNFFALGGNSILATQLISRIEKGLAMEEAIPAVTVFISPTVAELAGSITDIRDRQDDSQEILKILAQIENLSDEEAARLLDEQEKEHADGDRS